MGRAAGNDSTIRCPGVTRVRRVGDGDSRNVEFLIQQSVWAGSTSHRYTTVSRLRTCDRQQAIGDIKEAIDVNKP